MRVGLLNKHAGHTKSSKYELSVSRFQILLLLAVNSTVVCLETLPRETDKDSNQTRKRAIILADPLQQAKEGCKERGLGDALMEQTQEVLRWRTIQY
jgi:hypothetical protein